MSVAAGGFILFIVMAATDISIPSNDDQADQLNTTSLTKSRKKYYPFGTPNHGKVPFSDVAHLSPTNIQFVVHLTSDHNDNQDTNQVTNLEKSNRLNNSKKMTSLPSADVGDLASLSGIPESEKGIAPCTRNDCKEVILSIIDIQKKNQLERDEIVHECEKMIALHQQLEEEAEMIESENKRSITEGNILELRMKTLQNRLIKSQTAKATLDHERDELNSKVCS